MATVRVLLCIICLIGSGRCWGAERSALENRQAILAAALSQLHVKELTGKNDGVEVEAYLRYVGFGKGYAWCAAYVSWCHARAGLKAPKTAWSPALFPASRVVAKPDPGIVFGIYFASLGRIAHCGFVESVKGDFVHTLEGNTNVEGGRDGQGVYRRVRHKRTNHRYADWTKNN